MENRIDTFTFWERVKKLVRAHKISQEKFAAYLGINFSTFKSWLHFDRIPDVFTACDIADALGVPVEYLVRETKAAAIEHRRKLTFARKIAAADIKKMARRIEMNARMIG